MQKSIKAEYMRERHRVDQMHDRRYEKGLLEVLRGFYAGAETGFR